MELPEVSYGKCCLAEEELTLTPHHTPSQSFDFIVWDKAYLDSISADTATSSSSTTTSASTPASCQNCDDYQSCEARKAGISHSHTSSSPCLQTIPSSPSLLSCKTDADLPPCFITGHQLRLSDGVFAAEAAASYNACSCARRCCWANLPRLSSLEAAVRRHCIEGGPNPQLRQGIPRFTMQDCGTQDHPHRQHSSCRYDSQVDYHKQLPMVVRPSYVAHVKSGSSSSTGLGKALSNLTRSISQPGVLGSTQDGADTRAAHRHKFDINMAVPNPACKRNLRSYVTGLPGMDPNCQGKDQSIPLQDHAKLSCFPTGSSPGRRRRGHSIRETPSVVSRPVPIHQNCRENGGAADQAGLHDAHEYLEDFITLDMHDAHQAKHDLHPASPQSIYMGAARGSRLTSPPPRRGVPARMGLHAHGAGFHSKTWFRSLSEKSSQSCSSNDQYYLQNVTMSKLRWGGLNHRLRAMWRKFCSPYLSACKDKCETS